VGNKYEIKHRYKRMKIEFFSLKYEGSSKSTFDRKKTEKVEERGETRKKKAWVW